MDTHRAQEAAEYSSQGKREEPGAEDSNKRQQEHGRYKTNKNIKYNQPGRYNTNTPTKEELQKVIKKSKTRRAHPQKLSTNQRNAA